METPDRFTIIRGCADTKERTDDGLAAARALSARVYCAHDDAPALPLAGARTRQVGCLVWIVYLQTPRTIQTSGLYASDTGRKSTANAPLHSMPITGV